MEKKCKECSNLMANCTCSKAMCADGKCSAGQCCCPKKKCLRYLALGLCIAMGPALAGYFISGALKAPAAMDRFININVAVEKEEKSDYVLWHFDFQDTNSDIKLLQEKYTKDRSAIFAFLKKKGFKDEEIQIEAPKITDQLARRWGNSDGEKLPNDARYILRARITLSTTNVDSVVAAAQEQDILLKEGVILTQSENESKAAPRFYLKNQLKIEQDLYAEAIKKANIIAEEIAAGMNVKIKGLRSTEQRDPISIMSQDQSGGSTDNWGTKRLRGPIKIGYIQINLKYNIE